MTESPRPASLRPSELDPLDDPARLGVFRGRLLDRKRDAELQQLVVRASEEIGMPIALVSLILRRTQFFRATHGLPLELTSARATDRSLSLCQHVVRSDDVFEVQDAAHDDRVARELVDAYSIRSYLGVPVHVSGQAVGSLCVIGTAPRQFTEAEREELRALAARVDRRLGELAVEATDSPSVAAIGQALDPAFHEIRNIMQGLEGGITNARIAMSEMESVLRAQDAAVDDAQYGFDPLKDARRSGIDLSECLSLAERCYRRLARSFLAIQDVLSTLHHVSRVDDVVLVADALAQHATKLVGGLRWVELESGAISLVPRGIVVTALTALLETVADLASKDECAGPLVACARTEDGEICFSVKVSGLSVERVEEGREELRSHFGARSPIRVLSGSEMLGMCVEEGRHEERNAAAA